MDSYKAFKDRQSTYLNHALGKEIISFLDDGSVMEISINSDGCLWADFAKKGRVFTGYNIPPAQRENIIKLVADYVGMEATDKTPSIHAELPHYNARFQGDLPPIVAAPVISIRKHQSVLFSLDDYVANGSLCQDWKNELSKALTSDKKSILVAGGTASGKTTFVNALLLEVSQQTNDRILIIEDTKELQCQSKDRLELKAQSNICEMDDLVRIALRHSPDRIIVGEVRGKEALALINAWMVGHKGIATIHANSCSGAIPRLETLLTMAGIHGRYEKLIFTAVDVIVYIKKEQNKWEITEIANLVIDNDRCNLKYW